MDWEKKNFVSKGIMISVVVICFLYICTGMSYAAEKKAYVEFGKVFDSYEKTKVADEELRQIANKKQEERDALVEAIRRIKDEMVVLADDGEGKAKAQADIDQKIKELQEFDNKIRTELREIRDKNVEGIFNDINEVVSTYGKKHKYDLIFSDRALLYKNEKLNITEDILAELNK